jgi:hypothetical protein
MIVAESRTTLKLSAKIHFLVSRSFDQKLVFRCLSFVRFELRTAVAPN